MFKVYFVLFILDGMRYIIDDIKDFWHVGIAGTGLRMKRFFTLHPECLDTVL